MKYIVKLQSEPDLYLNRKVYYTSGWCVWPERDLAEKFDTREGAELALKTAIVNQPALKDYANARIVEIEEEG